MNVTFSSTFQNKNEQEIFRTNTSNVMRSVYENTYMEISEQQNSPGNSKAITEATKQTKCKIIFKVFPFILTFAAFATCFGLIGMISFQLNQAINHQKEVIDHHTQIVNDSSDVINHQNEIINNLTEIINSLKVQQTKFDDEFQALNEETNLSFVNNENLNNGYSILDDGWIAPFNGYKYKIVENIVSWHEARSTCQSYGSDLASFGVPSAKTRRILRQAIRYPGYIWIGLNDISYESRWRWIRSPTDLDGDYATNDISLWYRLSPTEYPNPDTSDCAALLYSYAYPYPCSQKNYFLCEKEI